VWDKNVSFHLSKVKQKCRMKKKYEYVGHCKLASKSKISNHYFHNLLVVPRRVAAPNKDIDFILQHYLRILRIALVNNLSRPRAGNLLVIVCRLKV